MEDKKDAKTQALVSKPQLGSSVQQETSADLPRNVSMQLLELMKQVVSNDVNPKTVNAACQCASEIHKILRLNFEMQKKGM